jgi:hypothetical protein
LDWGKLMTISRNKTVIIGYFEIRRAIACSACRALDA